MKRTQTEHERTNAREYPGTRQLCTRRDEPTGRCEDDAIYDDAIYDVCGQGPLCEDCMRVLIKAPTLLEICKAFVAAYCEENDDSRALQLAGCVMAARPVIARAEASVREVKA